MRWVYALLVLYSSAVIGDTQFRYSDCKVKDVIAVRSPVIFICRVDNWDLVGPARLSVTLRGIEVPDNLASEAQRFLEESLMNSKIIRLDQIEMGSYFRLTCNVKTDGRDLSKTMVQKGLAKFKEVPVVTNIAESIGQPKVILGKSPSVQSNSQQIDGRRVRITNWKSLLDRPVDVSAIQANTPFRQALELIRTSINPPLPLMINWKDIQNNTFIGQDNPVGIDGLSNISLGQILELLLNAVDGGKGQLAFATRGQVLVIASKRSLGDPLNLRVYDLSELTSPRSTGYGMNSIGMNGMNGMMGSNYGTAGSMGNNTMNSMGNLLSGPGSVIGR
jgi:hypothetical protein